MGHGSRGGARHRAPGRDGALVVQSQEGACVQERLGLARVALLAASVEWASTMTAATNKTKAAAELRCRNPRLTRGGWESPHKVACQSKDVAGVYDILDAEPWIHPAHKNPRRIPLCRECAENLGHFEDPVAIAADLPAMIGEVCWCPLVRTGLRMVWCPTHGLEEE